MDDLKLIQSANKCIDKLNKEILKRNRIIFDLQNSEILKKIIQFSLDGRLAISDAELCEIGSLSFKQVESLKVIVREENGCPRIKNN